MEKTLLERAIGFAVMKHEGGLWKGTSIPYVTHVIETMEIVCGLTDDEEVRAAAVLHDTLEDTRTTKEELESLFGGRVADLVAAESENKRKGRDEKATWLERKRETVRRLEKADTVTRLVSLGDKIANIRAIKRDWENLGDILWDRFNMRDPVMHGKYYGNLARVFLSDEELRDTPACREYKTLCEAVFGPDENGRWDLFA